MGQPYVGEIRLVGFSFAPAGWAFCDGSQLAISENDTLFNLIGTTFGGDGQETFNLPDLRGRIPIHVGPKIGSVLGEAGGTEQVTLTTQQIPVHNHQLLAADSIGGARPRKITIWQGRLLSTTIQATRRRIPWPRHRPLRPLGAVRLTIICSRFCA